MSSIRQSTFALLFLLVLTLTTIPTAHAQWTADGVVVHQRVTYVFEPKLAPDGTGGAFIAYHDNPNSVPRTDLFLQRIDGIGQLVWPSALLLSNQPLDDFALDICSDGVGGVYVAFIEQYSGAPHVLRVQRIDAAGNKLFTGAGLLVSTQGGDFGSMVPDGSGGVMLFWNELVGGDYEILGQRVSPSGTILWPTGPLPVCTVPGDQWEPRSARMTNGDAIVAWIDLRDQVTNGWDIYAARVAPDGTMPWIEDGQAVAAAINDQSWPEVAANPLGGAVLTWIDDRGDLLGDIYVQWLAEDGQENWTPGGRLVGGGSTQQSLPLLACDDAGNTGIIWRNYDISFGEQLWGQFVVPSGGTAYPSAIRLDSGSDLYGFSITSDTDGGIVVAWASDLTGDYEVYVRRHLGAISQYETMVSTAPGWARTPKLESDGEGGVLVAWAEDIDGRVQRLGPYGNWGTPGAELLGVEDIPQDEGGWVRIRCAASRLESEGGALGVTGYNVWRRINPGMKRVTTDLSLRELGATGDAGAVLSAAAALALGLPAGTWESTGFHAAVGLAEYAFMAPTHADSSDTSLPWESFCVTTHTTETDLVYTSLPDSGYSVDNLAPTVPKGVGARADYQGGGVLLTWNPSPETDLAGYGVYRGETEDFPTDPSHHLGDTVETQFFDPLLPKAPLYYKITAKDRHGNESEAAVLSPSQITEVEVLPQRRTFLAHNSPNPFNPRTTIVFALAMAGRAELTIYDAAGRHVQTLVTGELPEGTHRAHWDGRDAEGHAVSSGVYLYQLRAGDFVETKRMVLLK